MLRHGNGYVFGQTSGLSIVVYNNVKGLLVGHGGSPDLAAKSALPEPVLAR